MINDFSIKVTDVKKTFKVYSDKGTTFKDRFIRHERGYYEKRTVLDGISFEINKGEAVGLIGRNGCGKSTLLKLLTKIIFPDEGTIESIGRVSSLLELGAGFHPDMSGRENIYTNAAIFGLKKKEIDKRINDIVQFSELEEFIDNPVRTYSSGMYMRLAFSVAINVDADILLIDEILAVGDVSFQKKCLEKICEIKKTGTTIVLVSHSMGQIETICDRIIWLENGKIRETGDPKEISALYQAVMEEQRLDRIRLLQKDGISVKEDISVAFNKLTIRNGNGKVKFTDAWMEDMNGNRQDVFGFNSNYLICANYENQSQISINVIMSLAITRQDGTLCYATNSTINSNKILTLENKGKIKISVKDCKLLKGSYMLNLALTSLEGEIYDDLQRALFFNIDTASFEEGICHLECEWK